MSVPQVNGIAEADFQSWKHHPVTKVVLQYLRDYDAALQREIMARWLTGALDLQTEKEARGRCLTLSEVADLSFPIVHEFYQTSKDGDDAE